MARHFEPSLVRLVRERAQEAGDRVAYEFHRGDGHVEALTYAQLAEMVRRTAWSLRERQEALARSNADAHAPALLLYPPGLPYVVAIFACMAAGIPAVPAYPPDPRRPEATLERLAHLVADARPGTVLADEALAHALDLAGFPGLRQAMVSAGEVDCAPAGWPTPGPGGARRIAIVQYTSGSTRAPKGVIVRHANLDHNMAAIARYFGLTRGSRGFSWLPPYHDMGLVGGILTPMWAGIPVGLMSPVDFLREPVSWLRKISEGRVTATGGPNFGYDLCLRHIDDAQLAGLDLSSWQVAFNGAEPVRWQTLSAFARTFGAAGFRRSAFFPCYGLAEATLIVSGAHWDGTVRRGPHKISARERDGTDPGFPPARVSCGRGIPDQGLVIADPERRKPVPPGAEGEVWIRGPSVTTGYWPPGASHASAGDGELFAKLDGVRYLRTGDRGYLADGELVITGRLKDVIIARGVNYHAADLEDAAVAGDPRLRQVAAAFAADGDHPDSAVVIVVEARSGAAGAAQLVPEIRARVAARCGLVPDEIVVAPPGSIPRTSSGKVQRGLCRAHFAAGRFGRPRTQVTAVGAPTADGRPAGAAAGLTTAAGLTAAAGLTELLRGVFAASCDVPDCGAHTTLFDLGGDSLRAAEIAAVLQNVLGVRVTASLVLETPTPCRLAEQLARTWLEQNGNGGTLVQRLTNLADLSAGQEDEG